MIYYEIIVDVVQLLKKQKQKQQNYTHHPIKLMKINTG